MTVIRPIDVAVKAAVKRSTKPKYLTRTLWTAALVLGLSATAQAQQKPADETAPAQSGASTPVTLEEITVTGSRIKRTNDFNTPTPTTVIDSSAMNSMGVVNIGQTLQLTPANASTFTPANTGNSNFFTGAYIPDLRGLNPYFGSRTLTLVDGQRFVQTEQGDQIDLNFIPQIMVQRIDVVTGGASAAYGSGAIAGVENVILDNKLEGGKVTGDFYQTSHSDGRDHHFGAAYGHSMFDGKFHFTLGGEVEHQDPVGCQDARTWCANDMGVYQGINPVAGSTATYYVPGTGLRNFSSTTGVFVSGTGFPTFPANTFQGNSTGTGVTPYGLVQPYAGAGTAFLNTMPGGDGQPIYQYTNLFSQLSRGVAMGLFDGEITENIHWKGSLYYGKVSSDNPNVGGGNTFAFVNCNQNAYTANTVSPTLNAACNQQALFPGTAAFNKDWSAQVPGETQFSTRVERATFGLNGKFGESTWTWDANYDYGLTHHQQLVVNNIHNYASAMAEDSVLGPNGQPECRVTAAGGVAGVGNPFLADGVTPNPLFNPTASYLGADPRTANGCVPINPFGNQPLSAAQKAYAFGNLLEQLRYAQTDVNLNTSGEYFRGIGAGAWSAAVGYEYRQEVGANIDQPGLPLYIGADYPTQYGQSFGGKVTVHEAYLETNIPVLKDAPGAHLLEIDVAGREARYTNQLQFSGIDTFTKYVGQEFSHNLTTWKASVIWEPIEDVRLRASQSRDSRAANFRELYYSQVIGAGGLFGYCSTPGNGADRSDPCTWNLLGNPNLRPETSDTTTLGIVLTPSALPGFSFSADWFHIKIKNAIEQASVSIVENSCGAGVQSACNLFQFYNPGTTTAATTPAEIAAAQSYYQNVWQTHGTGLNVQSISPGSYNGAFYEVRGIDFSLQHSLDMGALGNLSTRLLTTWMDQQTFASCQGGYQLGCYTYSILGQTGTGNGFLNDYQPTARWRGTLMTTWTQGGLSITPMMNFVSHGTQDYLGLTPSSPLFQQAATNTLPANLQNYGYHLMQNNSVPSYFLFNLNTTYAFKEGPATGLELFAQVNNVFNKRPPLTGGASPFGTGNGNGGTNPIFFDTLGLAYRVGFRYTF
jgi:iron complex outermembrane recepter protein